MSDIHNDKTTTSPHPHPNDLDTTGVFKDFGFRELFFLWYERWILGLASGVLLTGILLFVVLKLPERYTATCEIIIESESDRVVDINKVVDTSLGQGYEAETKLNNHLSLLTSRSLRLRVLNKLSSSEKEILVKSDSKEPLEINLDLMEGILKDNLAINKGRRNNIFSISFTHRNASLTSKIANTVVEEYIKQLGERSQVGNEDAFSILDEQSLKLKQDIEVTEKELQAYRQKYNLVSLEENQNIVVERLKELNSALTKVDIEVASIQGLLNQIEKSSDSPKELLNIPAIRESGIIPKLVEDLSAIQTEIDEISKDLLELHPKMIASVEKKESILNQINQQIKLSTDNFKAKKNIYQSRHELLEEALKKAEGESLKLDKMAIEYNVMRRKLETQKTTFDKIVSRLNETNVSKNISASNIRIIDHAVTPKDPSFPGRSLLIYVPVMVFFGSFACVPLCLGLLDNRVKSVADIEVFLGSNLIGNIPFIKIKDEENLSLAVASGKDELMREGYSALYSGLKLLSRVELPKTFLITSTLPSEGKSCSSMNLGFTWEKHNNKVLLIDCDFRKPVQHKNLWIKNDLGVLHWLKSDKEIEPGENILNNKELGIYKHLDSNFYLLTSGGTTKDCSSFIEHKKFADLLKELKKIFDVIIIDTPPVGLFPDALFLAEYADEIIYICKPNTVSRFKVRSCMRNLQRSSGELIGFVFNQTKRGRLGTDYHYGYAYGYGAYSDKVYRDYYKDRS